MPNIGKNKKPKTCYMCERAASSKEHVPPISLFPEEKDIKTSVFRNNLITVPSCDLHNSKKSKDDEFLMACMAGIVGNNIIGFFHTHTKVKRALKHSGRDAIHILMKDVREVQITVNNKNYPVLVGKPDFKRLHNCFTHIAYGLYYHKFGRRFEGQCNIVMDFITYDNERAETYKQLSRKRIELDPGEPKKEGANPEIFRYEFLEPDGHGLIGLIMTFYEGAKIFIVYRGKECRPYFDLTGELIEAGIKTKVHFPDGSTFDFN